MSVDASGVNQQYKDLKREIAHLDTKMVTEFGEIHTEVGRVLQDLTSTQTELLALRRKFDEYVDEAARVARVQRSETKVGNLRSELDRQYGHYNEVRRTSVGILQAFDIGNVTNHTVGRVSEELMIQTPRYWLAPAIVAVAAWSRDDRDITRRSLDEAFARDKEKTSLFFALILRRQGRTEGAARWLRHYFTSLDPMHLTREFAVILEASAQGAFGPAGARAPAERIDSWMTVLRVDPAIVNAQVGRWTKWLTVNSRAVNESSYPTLATTSPDWPSVKRQLEAASSLPESTDALVTIRDSITVPYADYHDLLDELLEQLVTEYDGEELPLRREVAYHEAVIEEEGDLERATERADMLNEALEETIDVVTLQTMSAISPETLGVSVQTQRVAVGTARADLRTAVGSYTTDYRSRARTNIQFDLDANHSGHAQTLRFVGWRGNSNEDEAAAMQRLADAWSQTVQKAINAATFKHETIVLAGVGALILAIICITMNPAFGFFVLLVAGGCVGWWAYSKKTASDAEIARIRGIEGEARAQSQGILRQARAEFVDATITYQQLDALEPQLLRVIDTWATSRQEIR